MSFAAPLALAVLVALPLLVGAYILAGRRRRRAAARFANPALVPNLVPNSPGWRRHVPPALVLAALAVLAIGIARPHIVRDVTRNEATIVLAVDTSRSMAATDVQPESVRRGARCRRRVPRGGAGGVQRRDRLVRDLGRPRPAADDGPGGGAGRAARAASRIGDGDRDRGDARCGRRSRSPRGGGSAAARRALAGGRADVLGRRADIRRRAAASRGAARTASRRAGLGGRGRLRRGGRRGAAAGRASPARGRDARAADAAAHRAHHGRDVLAVARAPGRSRTSTASSATRLASDRKRVEVTSAFAAGGAVLLLLGGALSSHWFRRAL